MGNRAYVVFADEKWHDFSSAVYLQWNGGPESIYQFLAELDRRDVRADRCYEVARFCQMVGEYFDTGRSDSLSVGVGNGPYNLSVPQIGPLADEDNGLYVVCRDRPRGQPPIVRRFFATWQKRESYELPEKAYKLVEWTVHEVASEHDQATGHPYADPHEGMPATFAAIAAAKEKVREQEAVREQGRLASVPESVPEPEPGPELESQPESCPVPAESVDCGHWA